MILQEKCTRQVFRFIFLTCKCLHILVYREYHWQLVKLRGAGLTPHKRAPWPCAAKSVAVDDARDQAFVASGARVEIFSLQVTSSVATTW